MSILSVLGVIFLALAAIFVPRIILAIVGGIMLSFNPFLMVVVTIIAGIFDIAALSDN